MEDDDEFGDLYTDVLRPFAAASSPPPPPPPNQNSSPPESQSLRRPIDLNNLQSDEEDQDDGFGFGEAPPSSIPGLASSDQTLAPAEVPDSDSAASKFRAGAPAEDEDDVTFDIEEDARLEERGGGGGDDDWESDESEDDLQIVLNAPMVERGMEDGEDDEDEDDELVIVADGDPNQAMDEQDWGDEAVAAAAAQAGDGKEGGESGKSGGAVGTKVGYGSHGYHPFHSQFKYVRPGAVPISGGPTAGPGGVPGQVRPLANMGPAAGRGRGDWRPGLKGGVQMQKNFHQGWGGNGAGRGFGGGGGLDFTLPSHKSIFDIDIDSFEEKPWKYPGSDISDFFNFGFNEDGWKDYCKQLEHHRIESTMQSKIRVYESGRAEQEYDPDLPPELAAAAGGHEVPLENSIPVKSEVGQSDLSKGSARVVRPPLPTGRAIQVECGYGERLPSIDTRPPRMRDSDAIIEIILEGSLDDNVPAEEASNPPDDDDTPKVDIGGTTAEAETSQVDSEQVDQVNIDRKREQLGQKIPVQNSVRNDIHDRDGVLPLPPGPPLRNGASYVSVYPGDGFSPGYEDRQRHSRPRGRSPYRSPSRNIVDEKYLRDEPEDSVGSMDSKPSQLSSPVILRDARDSSVELRDVVDDQDDVVLADGRSGVEKGDSPLNRAASSDTAADGAMKNQKINPRSEDSFDQEADDGEDSRAARSSDNSRARSGSSRDYLKRRDGVEEEVIQRHSNRMGTVKRNFDDIVEKDTHRRNRDGRQEVDRNRDGRQEVDRNRMVVKGREDSYPYKEYDPSSVHPHMKTDGFERRKEREIPDGAWQRRDDDPYSRRIRTEETRKRERGEETGSRHRSKGRDGERSDKDELIISRKQMDNGNRVHYDKDMGHRRRERDDSSKIRYEVIDDYHGKRKKEEEHVRRDYADNKEEMLYSHRENTNRRKRERDDVLDPRNRDGRLRDNSDDHQSVRHKDESWSQRERGGERGREKEDWQRVRHSHDENLPKRERDEGRGVSRSGRGLEDKGWVGHPKAENKSSEKDYQYKEATRQGEPSKRRDRNDDESNHHGARDDAYARGNQMSNGERRSRQDWPRNDRSVTAINDQKVNDKKLKENARRNKESEGGDNNALVSTKRNQDNAGGQSIETGLKRQKEDGSDNEDSRRGRSKLERWTSHREREFFSKSKSSTTPKLKDPLEEANNIPDSKRSEEPPKPVEAVETQQPLAEERESAADLEGKDSDSKPLDDRHLDTVEKLKKRSERFKLPMPGEKESPVLKKVENEPPIPVKTVTPTDSEVKQERPARKRRWISN